MALLRTRLAQLLAAAAFCAPLGIANAAAPAPFSIADVLQAPYPTSLVGAPKDNGAAWVFDAKGVRNIWVADSAGGIARPVTAYTADDGYDIGDLAWSPDMSLIAFMRGQTLEDDRPANVQSAPGGPQPREIWVAAASGAPPRRIGTGHSPSFSPDGTRLVYLSPHQIMSIDPRGTGRPESLLTDQGMVRSATWSNDGRRLAFVSRRGSHSLVGIY